MIAISISAWIIAGATGVLLRTGARSSWSSVSGNLVLGAGHAAIISRALPCSKVKQIEKMVVALMRRTGMPLVTDICACAAMTVLIRDARRDIAKTGLKNVKGGCAGACCAVVVREIKRVMILPKARLVAISKA